MLRVEHLMTKKVITISESISVKLAASMMTVSNVSCLVVIKNNTPIGIITERDLTHKVFSKMKKNLKVKQVMTTPVKTVSPKTSVLEASTIMKYEKIKQLPVVNNNEIVGIITQTDIIWNLYDSFYLASFNKREIYVAFFIFCLMLWFFPVVYAFVFLGFVIFSQINVILHFLVRK